MIQIITMVCLTVPRKMKCFQQECVQMEGITTCNTVFVLWKQRKITCYCIIAGNHITVIAAHPLCVTSKNFLGRPFQHTQKNKAVDISKAAQVPLSTQFEIHFLPYGQPQQQGIEVARFYCVACSDANLLEKKKKDPNTSFNSAWKQGWVMLNYTILISNQTHNASQLIPLSFLHSAS